MEPRIHIITLGVQNIASARAFYEKLGWKASSVSSDAFVAFKGHGIVLCLFPEAMLAEDAHVPSERKGFRGLSLAYNVSSKEHVAKVLESAVQAGGMLMKPAQDVFWGGHSGYFADPDGHLWEVAWNPHWPLDANGNPSLPD